MTVLVSHDGPVAYLTLNRPERLNAITSALGHDIEEGLAKAAAESRVVVVRGAGGNFCAGGDVDELQQLAAAGPDALRVLFENFGRACALIETLPVPVVAAVEGVAMAGGFELMQACDIVLVSDTAKIADNHLNFGQIPGGGSTQRLPRLVGRQRALAHILTGDRLTGADAVAWGLAYRCFPAEGFEAAVAEFAKRLAAKSPEALAGAKRLVHHGFTAPLAEGLAAERAAVLDHLFSHGLRAFDERRP